MANATTMEKQAAKEAKQMDMKCAVESTMEARNKSAVPLYLGLTAGSIIFSLMLFWRKKKEESLFVGLWAPTFMGLGLLSKLAEMGSNRFED